MFFSLLLPPHTLAPFPQKNRPGEELDAINRVPARAVSVTSLPVRTIQPRLSRLGLAASLTTVALLGGCANFHHDDSAIKSQEQAEQMAIGKQLDAAIARVNDQPRWSTSLDDRAAFASFNTDAVSVSYQGSAADLLKAIAASRGKAFSVTGPNPHLPIFVFVETKGQPFESFMKDLDKQFGQRADIVVTDSGYELRYR